MTIVEQVRPDRAKQLVRRLVLTDTEERGMEVCYELSIAIWVGFIDDGIACIWGLIPPTMLSNQAYLWLYTTDLIKHHQFILIRHSQRVIERMLETYPMIVGHVTLGDSKAIRWLRWLGAEFGFPQGTGLPFKIRRH